MDRFELKTTAAPTIIFIHINGSLRIKGWDRSELRADCDREEAHKIEQTEDTITISTTCGCMVRVPMEATLQIGKVDGDLMIKSSEGKVSADLVSGQVMAKSIGSLQVAEVRGHFNVRGVEGDLNCQNVKGNASVQDIDGVVEMNEVKGNLVIKGYCGSVDATSTGNATLKLETEAAGTYKVSSSGNIYCRLEPETSAAISLESKSQYIKIKQEGGSEILKNTTHELTTGDGAAKIELKAKGNVDLIIPGENEFGWEFDFDIEKDIAAMADDISQVVTEQLETQLDVLGEQLSSLSVNLSSLDPEISEKTRSRIEAKRAKLERKLAKVERRAAEKAREVSRQVSRRYNVSTPVSDPVTDEERQKVLEMLQNKLISVEDAEALLAALEGKS